MSQWLSLVAIGVGGALCQWLLGWTIEIAVLLLAGLATWLLMSRARLSWLCPEPSLDQLEGLDALAEQWVESPPAQVVAVAVGPYSIGGLRSEATSSWSLSLSATDEPPTRAEARLVLGALARRLGCTLEGATLQRTRRGVFLWEEQPPKLRVVTRTPERPREPALTEGICRTAASGRAHWGPPF